MLSELYWESGELEKIETICKEGLEICEQHNDRNGQAKILSDILGRRLLIQHKLDEAIIACEESLKVAEPDDFISKALSLRLIGIALRFKRHYEEALKKLNESLILAKESGDLRTQVDALVGIGLTYRNQGNPKEAIKIYETIEKIVSQSKNLSVKARVLLQLGSIYINTGELNKGLKKYEHCLQISKELGDIITITDTLDAMGIFYS